MIHILNQRDPGSVFSYLNSFALTVMLTISSSTQSTVTAELTFIRQETKSGNQFV